MPVINGLSIDGPLITGYERRRKRPNYWKWKSCRNNLGCASAAYERHEVLRKNRSPIIADFIETSWGPLNAGSKT